MSNSGGAAGEASKAEAESSRERARPGGGPSSDGFDEFFVSILPRTIRAARRLTGDPWTAEDVAVEALAKAHARWVGSSLCHGATPGC